MLEFELNYRYCAPSKRRIAELFKCHLGEDIVRCNLAYCMVDKIPMVFELLGTLGFLIECQRPVGVFLLVVCDYIGFGFLESLEIFDKHTPVCFNVESFYS